MFRPMFLIVPFVSLIASFSVEAQSLPNLSIADQSRLVRDLTLTNSQDFFKRGQEQLEREIRLLERRSTQLDDLLKVDPVLRDPENRDQDHQSPRSLKPITLRK